MRLRIWGFFTQNGFSINLQSLAWIKSSLFSNYIIIYIILFYCLYALGILCTKMYYCYYYYDYYSSFVKKKFDLQCIFFKYKIHRIIINNKCLFYGGKRRNDEIMI